MSESNAANSLLVAEFHNLVVPSSPAEAWYLPFGEKPTNKADPSPCPLTAIRSCRVTMSHIRTVLVDFGCRCAAVAKVAPNGEKATPKTCIA